MATIQVRRGAVSGLPTGAAGEPLFTTDQHRLYMGSSGGNRLVGLLHKIDATTAPTVNEDAGDGFSVGSHWLDVTNDKGYLLIDSTVGSAVWQQISGAGAGGVADGDKGDITASSGGTVWTVDNDAITYAKLQNVSASQRVLGRNTAGSGDPEEVTLTQLLDWIGSAAQGDILYRGASAWARLAAGTSGQFLKTLGTGANPAWDAPSFSLVDDSVTNAKLANMANATIKGRTTAGTGDPEDLTVSQARTLLGLVALATSGAAGDITSGLLALARGGTNADLSAAGSGVLRTNGIAVSVGLPIDYICLRDEKTQNTAGGTFTSGAWRTRDLNVEAADTGNHCTLSSNQFQLAAGTYRVRVTAPAFNVTRHQARLYNVSAAAEQSGTKGTSEVALAAGGSSTTTHSIVTGRFTLASVQTLRVEHQAQVTRTTDGFGVEANFGTEVFTVVELWREVG